MLESPRKTILQLDGIFSGFKYLFQNKQQLSVKVNSWNLRFLNLSINGMMTGGKGLVGTSWAPL